MNVISSSDTPPSFPCGTEIPWYSSVFISLKCPGKRNKGLNYRVAASSCAAPADLVDQTIKLTGLGFMLSPRSTHPSGCEESCGIRAEPVLVGARNRTASQGCKNGRAHRELRHWSRRMEIIGSSLHLLWAPSASLPDCGRDEVHLWTLCHCLVASSHVPGFPTDQKRRNKTAQGWGHPNDSQGWSERSLIGLGIGGGFAIHLLGPRLVLIQDQGGTKLEEEQTMWKTHHWFWGTNTEKRGRGCEKETFANVLRGHWRKMYQVRRHLEDSGILLKDRNEKTKKKDEIPTGILNPFPCGLSKSHSAATCQGPWDVPPETATTLSGLLKPERHNSQCWCISIPWDTGLLMLCIFQRAHRAQALILWRKGLCLWSWDPAGSAHTQAGSRELCLPFPSRHSLTQQVHSWCCLSFPDLSHSGLALLLTGLGIFLTRLWFWEWVCQAVSLQENQFPPVFLFATTCGPRVSRVKAQLCVCTNPAWSTGLWSFPLCTALSWAGCISSTPRAQHWDVLPRKGADVNTSQALRAHRLHGKHFCHQEFIFPCWYR